MASYLYDDQTAPPSYNKMASPELKKLVIERVEAGANMGEVIAEMIVQLAALKVQANHDLHAAAKASQGPDEELAFEGDERSAPAQDVFAVMRRNEQKYQKARRDVERDASQFIAAADASYANGCNVAVAAMIPALQMLRLEEQIHESALTELDSLIEEISMASMPSTRAGIKDHVVWRMPSDLHALMQLRSERYTKSQDERPMYLRQALESLRGDVALWLEAADDRSYFDIYQELMEPSGIKAERYTDQLQELYPEAPRDLVGLVVERVHCYGYYKMPLDEMLRQIADMLAVSWARDTD